MSRHPTMRLNLEIASVIDTTPISSTRVYRTDASEIKQFSPLVPLDFKFLYASREKIPHRRRAQILPLGIAGALLEHISFLNVLRAKVFARPQ
jgi:hypothetical protein